MALWKNVKWYLATAPHFASCLSLSVPPHPLWGESCKLICTLCIAVAHTRPTKHSSSKTPNEWALYRIYTCIFASMLRLTAQFPRGFNVLWNVIPIRLLLISERRNIRPPGRGSATASTWRRTDINDFINQSTSHQPVDIGLSRHPLAPSLTSPKSFSVAEIPGWLLSEIK